ncbi:hypothetical protein [Enterobacter asburiae]|uniref:hypothetical protein n=1 Tax=Enterobacter asburiae TaxID=61645 RepID=UPI0032AE8417
MSITVLSDDAFLTLGIAQLFKLYGDKKYYLIDVDRVKNYTSIIEFLNVVSCPSIIVLILRGGVNSQPLMKLGGMHIDSPIEEWLSVINTHQTLSRENLIHLLTVYIKGKHLTNRQKVIKESFKTTLSIKKVAKDLALSQKTVWSHIDQISKKHNLSKFRDLMHFIRNN